MTEGGVGTVGRTGFGWRWRLELGIAKRVVTPQGLLGVCPSDACPTSSAGFGACIAWNEGVESAYDLKSSACDSLVVDRL
jgi:hypothetical protein